ncbi:MAG: SusC/RagA family TonB-linked outer membrane protein, partial [Salinibacter sp.]
TGYDERKRYFFQSDLSLTYDIPGIAGWTAEGTVAYDHNFLDRKRWQKPWTLYECPSPCTEESHKLTAVETGVPEPRLNEWDESVQDILLRATTTYDATLGLHDGSLLLGTEYQYGRSHELWMFRRFFPTDEIDELFAGGANQQDMFGTSSHSARFNVFGRVNYNYDQRYLLQVVARYDGSYIFPEGDRFGFFPSVSAGWRLAQEEWFADLTGGFFNRLKLRASFGQVGNDQIEPYQYLRTFNFQGKHAFGDGLGQRISPARVPNRDITWEVSTKLDVGLEGAIFSDRLSFSLTYFTESRDDILWFRNAAVPETAGFNLPRENIAKVDSRGFEGSLSYSQNITQGITLRGGVNFTYTHDEVQEIAEAKGVPKWQEQEGSPWNTELYYVANGIWNTQQEIDNAETHWPGARPGDVRFKDINDDGQITGLDRKRIEENGFPDVIGSFNLGATIGQFAARFLFQGAAQVRHYVFTGAAGSFGNYFQHFAERRWTPQNKDAKGPRAYNRVDPYWAANQNTYFLRDAKYLRLKSARIGYTVPETLTQRLGIGKFQVYLSGRNLVTFTPLDVMDPEVRSGGAQAYPPTRAYTFGIQTNF